VEVVIVMFNQICKEVTLKKLSEFLLFLFFERQNSSIFIIEKAKKAEKVSTEGKGQLHNGIIYEPTR
jgi:hypothetical protein